MVATRTWFSMQKHSNGPFTPSVAQLLLFTLGAFNGACQKPATQSATPESAPAATTQSTTVERTATTSNNTPLVHNATDGVSTPSAATASPTAFQGSWPSALAGMSAGENAGSSTFQGCLSKPVAAQNNPTRTNRTAAPDSFRVTPLDNGAIISHAFAHACCLSATTETTVAASTITIEERLVGTPCRCVCDSTIQTRVNVPAGDYEVRLVVSTNGVQSPPKVESLSVKKAIDRSAAP